MRIDCKRILISLFIIIGFALYALMRNTEDMVFLIKKMCKMGSTNIILLVGLILVYNLLKNTKKITFKPYEKAFVIVYGLFLAVNNRFIGVDTLLLDKVDVVLFSLVGFTLCYSIFILIRHIYSFIETSNDYLEVKDITIKKIFLIIVLLYLPFVIVFYPGSVSWDGSYQINEYVGNVELNNGHPILTTLFEGFLVEVGNGEFGVFLYSIFQLLFWIFVLSVGIKLVIETIPKKKIAFIITTFLICVPIPLSFNYVLIKDGFYASSCTLLCILILKNLIDGDEVWNSKGFVAEYVMASLGILFFRPNGIYVLVLSAVVIIFKHKYWKKILCILIASLFCYLFTTNYLEQITNAKYVEGANIYSLPLQQMTRYYKYYPSDFSQEEMVIINQMFDIDNAANVYDKMLSDPVCLNYKVPDKEIRMQFMEIWFEKFFNHPLVYVEAFLGNAGSYFDPSGPIISDKGFYRMESIGENDFYQFKYVFPQFEGIRKLFAEFYGNGDVIPVLGIFYHPGIYFIGMIALTGVYLRNNKKYIKSLVPIYVSFLVCIVSPVNGSIRYALPIIESVPLMLCMIGSKRLI